MDGVVERDYYYPPGMSNQQREHWRNLLDCIRAGVVVVHGGVKDEVWFNMDGMRYRVPDEYQPYMLQWLDENGRRVTIN